MHIYHDEDEWEVVIEHRECSVCRGDMRKCDGRCNGMSSYSLKRRDPKGVAKIKAERQRQREDEILAEADAIRRRRGLSQ